MLRSILVLSLLVIGLPAQAQVFWAAGGTPDRIESGNANGTNQSALWTSPNPPANNPWGVAYHPSESRVYWTDSVARQVNRVDADGSNFQTLFTYSTSSISTLALDHTTNELFFVGLAGTNAIVRSDFVGNTQNFVSVATTNVYLAIDVSNRFLYWTESANGFIRRANLDGTPTVEDIVDLSYTASPGARGIALDGAGGLYWVDNTTDFLYRVDLADYSGTALTVTGSNELVNLRTVINNTNSVPNGLASDGQFLFWAEGLSGFRGIYRADLNGGNAGLLFAGDTTTAPLGVAAFAVVPEPGTLILCGAGLAFASGIGWRTRKASRRQR